MAISVSKLAGCSGLERLGSFRFCKIEIWGAENSEARPTDSRRSVSRASKSNYFDL
jgi:hypothetical protein